MDRDMAAKLIFEAVHRQFQPGRVSGAAVQAISTILECVGAIVPLTACIGELQNSCPRQA